MAISLERMLHILQCPRNYEPLERRGKQLVTSGGGAIYPIVNGKPILVRAIAEMHTSPPGERIISKNQPEFAPPPGIGQEAIILHLGSGNIPSSDPRVISLDVLPTENVDIVAEAEFLPFKTASIDHVSSGAVFEHIPDPMAAIREVRRVLKPGGTFYIDTAFLQGYHGFPGHFFNMTPQAIETFLVDDFILEASVLPFPATGTAAGPRFIEHVLQVLPSETREQLLSGTLRDAMAKLMSGELAPLLSEAAKRSIAVSHVVSARKPERYEERSQEISDALGVDEWKRLKRSYYAARTRVISEQGALHALHAEAFYDHKLQSLPAIPALSDLLSRGAIMDPMDIAQWTSAIDALNSAGDELIPTRDYLTRLCLGARK